jgi:long-chain acyl-CoA synthetase
MRTIREAVDRHSVTQPDAPFLLAPEPGTTISYAGLRVTAQALCAELAAMGVRPGEVVSYLLPNGVAAASVFLGAMYGGFVVSPISMLAQDALVEHNIAHSETRVVYVAPEFVERLEAIVARIGSRAIVRPTSPDGLQLPRISDAPPAGAPAAREPALHARRCGWLKGAARTRTSSTPGAVAQAPPDIGRSRPVAAALP